MKGFAASSKAERQPLQERWWDGHFLPVCGAFCSDLTCSTQPVVLSLKYLPLKEDVKLQFPSLLEGIWIR